MLRRAKPTLASTSPRGSSEGVSCRRAFEWSANGASNKQTNVNTYFFRYFF